MIPNDHLMIWTEVYSGIPGKPRTKCLDYGWCCLPKDTPIFKAVRRIDKHFHTHDYAGKTVCVMAYPEDRCAKKFKASDRILGIFA